MSPPAIIYREEVSPRRFHTGKISPPGDISHGKKSPVGGKIIRPRHEKSAYRIIIPPTPCDTGTGRQKHLQPRVTCIL